MYIYNNTIYSEAVPFAAIDGAPATDAVTFHNGGTYTNIQIKNNIGYGHFGRAAFTQENHADFTDLVVDYNSWTNLRDATHTLRWDSTYYTLSGIQSATGQEKHGITGSPRFSKVEERDFTLQSTSKAIDAGGPALTTTVGSGSGTTLTLADAGFFIDGFGLVAGDMIQVGSNSPVQITSIDYGKNTVTVARSLSWSNGQGVSLPYSGTRPDIGAHEYQTDTTSSSPTDTTSAPPPPRNLRVN